MKYDVFKVLMSCYDWHLGEIDIHPQTMYSYIRKIRRNEKYFGMYFLKPLGFKVFGGMLRNSVLSTHLLSSIPDSDLLSSMGFPFPRLIHSITILPNSSIYVTWYIPSGLDIEDYLKEFLDQDYGSGIVIPIQNCVGVETPVPDEETITTISTQGRKLINVKELRMRTPLVAYIIVSLFVRYPLESIRSLSKIELLQNTRDIDIPNIEERIREKYLRKYYRLLSENYVVGRVFVYDKDNYIKMYLEAPRERFTELYGILGASRISSYLYIYDDRIVTGIMLSSNKPEKMKTINLLYTLCPSIKIVYRIKTYAYPLPFEMYDPIENKWMTEPNKEMGILLNKLRIIE